MSFRFACEAVAAVSVVFFATAFAVTWKDCGSKLGVPTDVTVQGCAAPGTCILHKGVNASFGVSFKSNEDASGLKMLLYGHIAGFDVPFPLDNPDACKDSNITCPIKKDQAYAYRNVIFVKTSYPSLSLVVKMKLVDENGNVIVCVVLPVQIESVASQRLKPAQSPLRFVQMH